MTKTPRHRVHIVQLSTGWAFHFTEADGRKCERGVYASKRAATSAARRLLAAIKAGDVDETEIGG